MTQGSIIALPAYPAGFFTIGGILLAQSPQRTLAMPFEVARDIMEIHTWGAVFIAVAAVEMYGLLKDRRALVRGLVVGAGMSGFWAALLLVSAAKSAEASYTSGVWVILVMVFHIASVRSLTRDVVLPK